MGVYISRIWGEETPLPIVPDFFLVKDIHDVITHAKFGDDRLRGLGVVAGQISAFSIDFAGRPYNTLTLPCERVMECERMLIRFTWAGLRLSCGRSPPIRTYSVAICR